MLAPYTVGARPERIDRIVKRLYGIERGGALERLWAANYDLALQGPYIAPGTVVQVPDPVTASKPQAFVLPWE